MVLPLNDFSSANLILIYGWFLLFSNKACVGIISGVVAVYMGMKKSSMDGLEYCSAIIAFFFNL